MGAISKFSESDKDIIFDLTAFNTADEEETI